MPYPSYQGSDPDAMGQVMSPYTQMPNSMRNPGQRQTYGNQNRGGFGMGGGYQPGIFVNANSFNYDANLRNIDDNAQYESDNANEVQQDQYRKQIALAAIQNQAQNQPAQLDLSTLNTNNALQQGQGVSQADHQIGSALAGVETDPTIAPQDQATKKAQVLQGLMQQNSNNPYYLSRAQAYKPFIQAPFTGQDPSRGITPQGYVNPDPYKNLNLANDVPPSTTLAAPDSTQPETGRLSLAAPKGDWLTAMGGYQHPTASQPGDVDAQGNPIPVGTVDPQQAALIQHQNDNLSAIHDGLTQLVAAGVDPVEARDAIGKITNNGQSDFDPAAFKDKMATIVLGAKGEQAKEIVQAKGDVQNQMYQQRDLMRAANAQKIADENNSTKLQIANLKASGAAGGKASVDQAKTLEQYQVAKDSLDDVMHSLGPELGGTGTFDPTSFGAAAAETKDGMLHFGGPAGDWIANKTDNPDMKNYEAAAGNILATLYHQMYGARITAQEMQSPKMNGVRISLANAYLPNYGENPQTAQQKIQRLQLAIQAMSKRAGVTDADKYALAPLLQSGPPTKDMGLDVDKDIDPVYKTYLQPVVQPNVPQVQPQATPTQALQGNQPQTNINVAGSNPPKINDMLPFVKLANGNIAKARDLYNKSGGDIQKASTVQ